MMPDRTIAPSYIESTSFDLISPQRKKLNNGVEIFYVRGGSQDVLKVELLFRAGRWHERKAGSAYFTAHLLNKGTRYKDSFQIAELLDRYGAHLEVQAGMDTLSVSLYALGKKLEPALHVFREILREPVFPKKEIDLAKSIYLQNLKINNEKTSFIASKAFRKNLFGDTHPYGRELEERDVNALTQQHLFDHYDHRLQDFTVFVSGKVEEAYEQLIGDVFNGWTIRPGDAVTRQAVEHEAQSTYIERANAVQSSLRFGRRSLVRTDPDYVEAIFVSHILGGYFGSRLMKNIREDKGLTYGIYSSIHALQHGSYLVIGADVNKENIRMAFDEIRKELNRLRTEEISPDELTTARNHFIGSLQGEITTPFAHADKLKTLFLYGLPDSYYHNMISRVQRILPGDILTIAQKHFNEADFIEVAAG